ncbi:MAG TPA: HD domain-containing protein [Candidatus Limnocylindrales bacterium]|nr:HD domain-containing protein [Candidatus Limnocylindrales bacterium]
MGALDSTLAAERLGATTPPHVLALVAQLHRHGHAAYVVGGSVRDALIGRQAKDWDLATDARPERMLQLLPGAVYENAFGTVAVRRDGHVVEITTFRVEHEYADFRRPHTLEFGDDIRTDLARRDFTVNAIAWGVEGDSTGTSDAEAAAVPADMTPDIRPDVAAEIVDPFGGIADVEGGVLRAVGDPDTRFREDALRMVRAVRLVATLGFEIEPATRAAIEANAALVAHLSGERIGAELARLLAAPRPSVGLRLAHETGLLAVISPELAAQRGVLQNKIEGEDLWDHTLRSVDAAPADRPIVRLAALLHDIGKPATLADGHFHHHDAVGAAQADELLRRLRYPRAAADEVVDLVRHHMFTVDPDASGAAIRRFIKRIGRDRIDALLALRRADDIGSGRPGDSPTLAAFQTRIDEELAAEAALDRYALKIDGTDLIRELRLEPGPRLGRVLNELVERVIADPALNEAPTLLLLAQGMLADMRDEGTS